MFKDKKIFTTGFFYNRNAGNHICPLITKILLDNIVTTEQRITQSSALTIEILNRLKNHNKIIKLNHPYITNSSYVSDKSIFPSVFTIVVYGTKARALFAMKHNDILLKHETSFGCEYSKTDPWPTESKDGSVTLRISIGWKDDIDFVYGELLKILEKL